MGAARFGDLLAPSSLTPLIVFLGALKGEPRIFHGSFVPLRTADHPAEPPRRFGLEARPAGSRKGKLKLTQVQRQHVHVAPQRGQADPRIPGQRRSQQVL
ncbi:MAG: hypothetical protein ACLPN6_01775 [Streptosporangiaceae bacterium]